MTKKEQLKKLNQDLSYAYYINNTKAIERIEKEIKELKRKVPE